MFTLYVARRHLRSRSISWVASLLIALVVTLYLLTISVLEGQKEHWMDKLQNIMAHLTVGVGELSWGIQKPEAWAKEVQSLDPGIRGVTPGIESPAMAIFDSARTIGTLRGIDLADELKYGRLKELIQPPELRSTLTEFGSRESGGKELAGCIVGGFWRKNYDLKLGDRVTFLFSDEDDNARTVAFVIIGFFEGNNPYLENAAYIDRRLLAEKLNVKGSAKTLFVWLNDGNRKDLEALRERIRMRMQNAFLRDVKGFEQLSNRITVETWQEKDNGFYKAMTAENRLMRAIMVFFLALLAFIIYLIFGRLVAEKIRDIGTLRALGCTPGQIRAIFLGQALLIGTVGCAAGLLFAWLLIGNLNSILQFLSSTLNLQLFPPDLFGPNRVLTRVLPLDVVLICGLTLVFSLLGALLPAVRASRLNPVECLRHE